VSHRSHEALREIPRLAGLPRHACRRMHQPACEPIDALRAHAKAVLLRAHEAVADLREAMQQGGPIGGDQCRGGRGCRRARVGHEIADREVRLVSHAGHDGQHRFEHGARERGLVERPEIFQRPAAAADDQQLDLGAPVGGADGRSQLVRRARPLHGGGVDDHAQPRCASPQRSEHVVECRRLAGSHKADSPWETR